MKRIIAIIALAAMLPCIVRGDTHPVFWDDILNGQYWKTGVVTNSVYTNNTPFVVTNDSRQLDFSGGQFKNKLTINCTSTNSAVGYDLEPNGLLLTGTEDKWVKWNTNGFSLGTYRGESDQYMYLFSEKVNQNPLTVSDSGRFGVNKETDVENYHSRMTDANDLDDFSVGGIYSGKVMRVYQVITVTTNVTGTDYWIYAYSTDSGATYTTNFSTNAMSTTALPLERGVTVKWDHIVGHSLGGARQFSGTPQLPTGTFTINPSRYDEIITTTNYLNATVRFADLTYNFNTKDDGNPNTVLQAGTNSAIYIGSLMKRSAVYFDMSVAVAGAAMVYEYWNGNAWKQITVSTNNLLDLTANLTQNGVVTWYQETMSDWTSTNCTVDTYTNLYFWIRARSSTPITTAPTAFTISPNGQYRFAVYGGSWDYQPQMYVASDGVTYAQHGKRLSTGAYTHDEWTTDDRVQYLIKSAQGTYYYPSTNTVPSTSVQVSYTAPQSFAWVVTNAVTANSTNNGQLRVITNSNIGVLFGGTNYIPSGTRFTLRRQEAANGNAGFSSVAQFQLIEWNAAGTTNIIGTSGQSLALPSQASPFSDITLTYTAPTNQYLSSTSNLVGWKSQLITSGNKAGTWLQSYGSGVDSYMILGSIAAGASTGIQDAPSDGYGYVRTNGGWGRQIISTSGGSSWGGGVVSTNIAVSNTAPMISLQDSQNPYYTKETRNATNDQYQLKNMVYKPGVTDYAFNFVGTAAGWVDGGTPSQLDFGAGDYTISFWFKQPSTLVSAGCPIGKGRYLSAGWYAYCSDSDFLYTMQNSGSQVYGRFSGCFTNVSSWYFIAVTRSGTSGKFYVNGVSSNFTATTYGSGEHFYVSRQSDGSYCAGTIDEIAIWSRALSSPELSDLYNGGSGRYASGTFPSTGTPMSQSLQYNAHCDEGTGSYLGDSSTNAILGTLVGTGQSWGSGKVQSGQYQESIIINCQDGTTASNNGVTTFGDPSGSTIVQGSSISFSKLPTNKPSAGCIWNSNGTLCVSQ